MSDTELTRRGEGAPTLTVLGAGTLAPDGGRHSAAHHLDLGASRILFDCGPGTLHGCARYGVDWQRLTHIAVTHYHLDHIGDLAAVMLALKRATDPPRSEPITLVGPIGFRSLLDRVADALGDHVLHPGFPVRVVELAPAGALAPEDGTFALRCHPTPHTSESVAYRVEGPWGAVGYTGDTGPSRDVGVFLRGCRVVVAECTLTDPADTDNHLSPASLAELASVAEPELLVVTHVAPGQTPEEAVHAVRERFPGVVVAGRDGMWVSLASEAPGVV